MTGQKSGDELELNQLDIDEMPDNTTDVLAACYHLGHNTDRRVTRRAIREVVDREMSRDQVRYRVDELVTIDALEQDSYKEHNNVVHEFYIEADWLEDAATCYHAIDVLSGDDPADPDAETIIALAGRLRGLERSVDALMRELAGDSDALEEAVDEYDPVVDTDLGPLKDKI